VRRSCLLLLCFVALFGALAQSQSRMPPIAGTVVDPSGATVADAAVTLKRGAKALSSVILNHVNYVAYVGNLQSPFFGQAVSAFPARRLQITTRFKF